jgi:hypothetical protein
MSAFGVPSSTELTSAAESLKLGGDQPSNLWDNSRTAASPRCATWSMISDTV